jgi:hypothetical protein
MGSKTNVLARGGDALLVFLWGADRDAALAAARDAGCVLGLWFKIAQQREKHPQDFATWLMSVHRNCRARFGVARLSGAGR